MKNDKVVEESADETTSQDSSPQSEEEVTSPQTDQEEVAPQENPDEVSEETSDADVEEVESTMTEEQRKAFQEQRLEIKRLKEEREARAKGENAFDVFRPKATTTPDINSFVNTETGEVNWQAYNQSVVNQAQAAAAQTVQEQIDENNARQKYPDVFADTDLEEALAGQWFANKMQGKDVSISELAEKFSRKLSKATTKAEKEGAKKALTELTPKEQASLNVQTQSSGSRAQTNAEEEASLHNKARYGDDDALARLMGSVAWKK